MASWTQIRIPEQDYESVARFANLSDADAAALLSVFRECPPTLKREELVDGCVKQTRIPREVASGVVRVLLNLYALKGTLKRTSEQIADMVVRAISEIEDEKQRPAVPNAEHFRDRLKLFLELDESLGVTSKALDLYLQHQRLLHESRIITDVRPVFGSNVSVPPKALVVSHTLKMVLHKGASGETHEELFVALDSKDLEQLAEVVKRAQEKERTIRSTFVGLNVPFLSMSKD